MDKYTADNPGCIHSLLKYLSEKTGIPEWKELKFSNSLELTRLVGRNKKRKLKYPSYRIKVEFIDGTIVPFINETGHKYDYTYKDKTVKNFIVNTRTSLEEYGIEVKNAGKYKECLGGGWTTNTTKVTIDGKFFAYLECSCGS